MSQDQIHQEFTKEQLEELQMDSALGGDIPVIGLAGTIGRKSVIAGLEAAAPYVKRGVEAARPIVKEGVELAKEAGEKLLKFTHIVSEKQAAEIAAKGDAAVLQEGAVRAGLGLAATVGVSATAATIMANKAEKEQSSGDGGYKDLANKFKSIVASDNSDKALSEIIRDDGPLKGAAFNFLKAKNGLMQDGVLDAKEKYALTLVGQNIANMIEKEGPQAFDKAIPNSQNVEVRQLER